MKRALRIPALVLLAFLSPSVGWSMPAVGDQAPRFTLRELADDSKSVNSQSLFGGKTTLLSFFATWCKPCLIELKHLQKLYKKYKSKGFVVLAVSMDGPETRAKVKPLVKRYKLTFPVVIDKETRIVKLYNPKNAAPFSVFIKKGKVTKTREGFQVSDLSAIEQEVKDLIK